LVFLFIKNPSLFSRPSNFDVTRWRRWIPSFVFPNFSSVINDLFSFVEATAPRPAPLEHWCPSPHLPKGDPFPQDPSFFRFLSRPLAFFFAPDPTAFRPLLISVRDSLFSSVSYSLVLPKQEPFHGRSAPRNTLRPRGK